jgi:hypothetical protein
MALQPFVGPWPLFIFLIFYTDGRTPWTGDQPVARSLSTHIITQTDNHDSSGIRTHDQSVRAGEDGGVFSQLSFDSTRTAEGTMRPTDGGGVSFAVRPGIGGGGTRAHIQIEK